MMSGGRSSENVPTRRNVLAGLACAGFSFSAPGPSLAWHGAGPGCAKPEVARDPRWARPTRIGQVANLYQVTPRLFRSAQPDREGFRDLRAAGILTVVSLRRDFDDAPDAIWAGLTSRQVRMKSGFVEEDDAGRTVLAMHYIRQGMAAGPVLVHCRYGSDRTGLMIALFRILYQDWGRDSAIAEMRFGCTGFHKFWANIPAFLMSFDIGDLRARID